MVVDGISVVVVPEEVVEGGKGGTYEIIEIEIVSIWLATKAGVVLINATRQINPRRSDENFLRENIMSFFILLRVIAFVH